MKFKRLFSLCMVFILALAGSLGQPAAVWAGSGWLAAGSAGFSAGVVDLTSLAIDSSGNPYVAYVDFSHGGKVTVMKYNGTTWETVGTPGFSADVVEFVNLALDHNNTPYVAYMDHSSYQAMVMKFNGTAWVPVGPATGLSGGLANYLSLTLDSSGTPYLAFEDTTTAGNNKATVMKFNSTTWETVGPRGFTSGAAGDISLKLDKNNIPYISYRDGGYNSVSVMKYSGGAWQIVGSPLVSTGDGRFTSLALDSNNQLYVAYTDLSISGSPVSVMKYNGSAWVLVGAAGFSLGGVSHTVLALDSSDTPYVAYQENGTPLISNKATVMKFNGSAWAAVGTAGFSPSTVTAISLALDSGGIPYVSYADGSHGNYATVMKYYQVLPPTDFNKTIPSDAAKDVTPYPILSWGASSGAASYEYCYDTINNNVCDSTWLSAGVRTSVTPTHGLQAKTTYYWQVRAVNTGGMTYADASTWGSFSTGNYKVTLPFLKR